MVSKTSRFSEEGNMLSTYFAVTTPPSYTRSLCPVSDTCVANEPKTINHVALAIDMGDGTTLVFETTAKTNDGKNQWLGKAIYGYWFDV